MKRIITLGSSSIQLDTDDHLLGSEVPALELEATVRAALGRFTDRITRVEVHLNDLNSGKTSGHDKRCMMEALVIGRQAMSVIHAARTLAFGHRWSRGQAGSRA